MVWFIVWMLLTADEPSRDGGISPEEKDYIIACINSQSHLQIDVQQVNTLLCIPVACSHRRRDKTREFCLVRVGGVNKPSGLFSVQFYTKVQF